MNHNWNELPELVYRSAVFATLGIILFAIAFWVMSKICPFSIRKEIEEDQNTALAIVMGAVILGIALIVSTSIS
jgi:uncharacterized membrane protein YjfL (UPF0719 family)